jgi:hypothetical protein
VAVNNPKAAELASGPGEVAMIPFFRDITGQDDELQIENAEPLFDNIITAGVMKAIACNRVTKSSATACSAQLSGEDPVGEIVAQMLQRRLKQRQKSLLAIFRGGFGSAGAAAGAADVAAPLKPVRVDAFDESGNDATADHDVVRAPNVAHLDHREIRGRVYPDCAAPATPAIHLSQAPGEFTSMHTQCVLRLKPQWKDSRPRFVFQREIRPGHVEVPGGRLSLEGILSGDDLERLQILLGRVNFQELQSLHSRHLAL